MQQSTIDLLVVDDSPEDRAMIEYLLGTTNGSYSIRQARTAKEGIAECSRRKPDCILLDYNLPDKNGLDCLQLFRTASQELSCAVILLTGTGELDLTKRALSQGVQDYILKSELAAHTLERAIDHAILRCRLIAEREEAVQALRHNERLLRLAQEAAGIGTFSWNLKTHKTEFGGTYFSLYGLRPSQKQITFADWLDRIHPEDRDRIRKETEAAIASPGQFSYEYRVVWPDESVHWLLSRGSVVTDDAGSPLEITGVNLDVTASKSIEQALAKANDELRHFAYAAGHDLQAPLRNVIAFTELLERTLGTEVNAKASEALAFVRSSSRQMRALVNDLLEYAQSGDNKETPSESAPLDRPLRAALANLRMDIEDSGAVVTWDETLSVIQCPAEPMVQVFQNLVGNAIKHRRKGVSPVISISATREDAKWVISVQDNGIGFDMQYASLIFQPFKRLANVNTPGSGLGLSICKRVVERWGGEIWATSKPGWGSTFFFTLPASDTAAPSQAGSLPRTDPGLARHVD